MWRVVYKRQDAFSTLLDRYASRPVPAQEQQKERG